LIEKSLQEDIEKVDIVPSIKSDHSSIILKINSLSEHQRGPSYWKFNTSLLEDTDYITLIKEKYEIWLEEFKEIRDKRVLWDLIKYRIRQITMNYTAKIKQHNENVS